MSNPDEERFGRLTDEERRAAESSTQDGAAVHGVHDEQEREHRAGPPR